MRVFMMSKKQIKVKPKKAQGRVYLFGWIYAITNLITGKMYIGQTVRSLAVRWSVHRQCARHGEQSALCRAIRKYGEENFLIEPICSCPVDLLYERERYFIAAWDTGVDHGRGYNLTAGGDGLRPSEVTRGRMSDSARRRFQTEEGRAHAAYIQDLAHAPTVNARRNVTHRKTMADPAVRSKLSDALLSYYAAHPEAKAVIAKQQKDYAAAPEVRARLSLQAVELWNDFTKRANLTAIRNTQCTDAVRAKMRISSAKRWAKASERVKHSVAQRQRFSTKGMESAA
jgi:group I intron endonuclease